MDIDRYFSANAALNRYLLSGRFAGRPLYLTLDDEGRATVADDLGVNEAGIDSIITEATKSVLSAKGDPYGWLGTRADQWQRKGYRGAPPITAALYTLSHAAERMHGDEEYSSSNYYSRLEELVGIDRDRLSFHGKSTQPLWSVFNRWLASTDFEYGRPTARPINTWVYVGLAMSQAVVTLADRKLFHSLFNKYGFSGNDELSKQEMEQYLEDWMGTSQPNARLKSSWNNPSLRDRVSEAAIAELQEWSASQGKTGGDGAPSRLSVLARIVPQFPKARLVLALGRNGELAEPIGPLFADGVTAPITLGHTESGTFATLTPNVATGAILQNGITLRARDANVTLAWAAKLVVPLVQSASGNFWVEVTRTTLLAETMLLVRNVKRVVDEVGAYLSQAALPGWAVSTPAELAGVPDGWLLFTSVQILKPGVETKTDLQALVPLASSAGLVEEGGLRLDRDIWHSHEPPSFKFMGLKPPTRLEIRTGYDGDGDCLASTKSAGVDCMLGSECLDGLQEGNFAVIATSDGRESARSTFALRSARQPRPMDRQGSGLLSYSSVYSASTTTDGADEVSVSGHAIKGVLDRELPVFEKVPIEPSLARASSVREEEASIEALMEASFTPPPDPTCVQNGYHHWLYETVERDGSKDAPVARECKHCLHATLEYRRKRQRAQAHVSGSSSAKPATPLPRPITFRAPRLQARATIDHDLLIDALCFIGAGKWGRFEALALRTLEHPWQAVSLAKDLSALGLLDVAFAPGTGRPVAWSVPAPVLSFTSGGRAFFTGFRCGPLFKECRDRLQSSGAQVEAVQRDDSPSKLAVSGISPSDATLALEGVRDPHNRSVEVLPDAPIALSKAALSVAGIASACTPMELGASDGLRYFDLSRAQWRDTPSATTPGAYLSSHAGRTYAIKSNDGRAFSAPFEIAKTLAAAQAGTRLHAYNPDTHVFTSLLGAEPPGLLARTLVACSGDLPMREGGTVTYAGVPPRIAATVLQLLYDESQFP